jgi:hypothetical protein
LKLNVPVTDVIAETVITVAPAKRYGILVVPVVMRSILRVVPTLAVLFKASRVTVVDAGSVSTVVQELVLIVAVRLAVAAFTKINAGYAT